MKDAKPTKYFLQCLGWNNLSEKSNQIYSSTCQNHKKKYPHITEFWISDIPLQAKIASSIYFSLSLSLFYDMEPHQDKALWIHSWGANHIYTTPPIKTVYIKQSRETSSEDQTQEYVWVNISSQASNRLHPEKCIFYLLLSIWNKNILGCAFFPLSWGREEEGGGGGCGGVGLLWSCHVKQKRPMETGNCYPKRYWIFSHKIAKVGKEIAFIFLKPNGIHMSKSQIKLPCDHT